MTQPEKDPRDDERRDDHAPGRPGAEGGDAGSADVLPAVPAHDDESPLGDTDQHSDADA